jgi:hypothetical protein
VGASRQYFGFAQIPDTLEKARDFGTVTASEVALGLGTGEICRCIRNKGSRKFGGSGNVNFLPTDHGIRMMFAREAK